jgi:hypothetical protein
MLTKYRQRAQRVVNAIGFARHHGAIGARGGSDNTRTDEQSARRMKARA